MHFEGTFQANPPKERVYDFLMDPNQLSQCMPDLQRLKVKSSGDFITVVKSDVFFIK